MKLSKTANEYLTKIAKEPTSFESRKRQIDAFCKGYGIDTSDYSSAALEIHFTISMKLLNTEEYNNKYYY